MSTERVTVGVRVVMLEEQVSELRQSLGELRALVIELRRHEPFCELDAEHQGPCQDGNGSTCSVPKPPRYEVAEPVVLGPPVSFRRPPDGWEKGYHWLLAGRCPYCREKMQNIDIVTVSAHPGRRHVCWSCIEGCNP